MKLSISHSNLIEFRQDGFYQLNDSY